MIDASFWLKKKKKKIKSDMMFLIWLLEPLSNSYLNECMSPRPLDKSCDWFVCSTM